MGCFSCFRPATNDQVATPPVTVQALHEVPDPGTRTEEVPDGRSTAHSSIPAGTSSASEWVVGLDFGTTFSGFAYARRSEPGRIHTYYDWPTVVGILDLIAAQLVQTKDIEVMFVVGGFAGSPYLMNRIRTRFSREVAHIVSPPSPGSAVVQGAVALALTPDAVESRIAKKTYGIGTNMPFVPGIDPEDYATAKDGHTGLNCDNRFCIFVKRGSRVEVNSCVTKPNFTPLFVGQKVIRFDLFSSTELSPRYTDGDNVTKEGGILIDLPKDYSASNKPKTDLSMYFGRASIELKAVAQFKPEGNKSRVTRVELPVQYHL